MKIISNIFLALIICGLLGCNDFLKEEAYDTYTNTNFPKTKSDAEALVNQIYREEGSMYARRYFWITELHSEVAVTRGSGQSDTKAQFDNWTVVNSNGYLQNYWTDSYRVIKQANAVIALYEGESSIDKDLADRLVAEAKVLRANTYFNLSNIIGDVPLILDRITKLDSTARKITPLPEIYKAVINDLESAVPNLPDQYDKKEDLGRVTKGGAQALLGAVYLQRGGEPRSGVGSQSDYQEALNWLRKVRDEGKQYELEPKFINLFGLENLESSKSSNEIVLQLWRDAADCCDNLVYQHIAPRNSDWGPSQWGNIMAEVPFYLSYEKDDERFDVTFLDTINTKSGETFTYDVNNPGTDGFTHDGSPFTKLIDINSTDGFGGNNFFLIRYSDVLLMIAEASNEVNQGPTAEAYTSINKVRARARNTPSALPDLSGLSYEEFRTAVYNERRWELAFEGHDLRDGQRFYDIFKQRVEAAPNYQQPPVPPGVEEDAGRRDDAVPDLPITVTKENIRMPIPLNELDSNPNIEQ